MIDVVELLARHGSDRLRFADVVRELGLTHATAHSILKTLDDRGWIARDPVDKTFSLGPGLAIVAARIEDSRPLARKAQRAAALLSDELEIAASVVERIGDTLVITAYEEAGAASLTTPPGEPIPFAPPFGVAFAAWSSDSDQHDWIARCGSTSPLLAERLQAVLRRTRERGFDVDRTTPALGQMVRLVGAAREDVPVHVQTIMEQLLVECATIGIDAQENALERKRPIASVSVPVYDRQGRIPLVLSVQPMARVSERRLRTLTKRLGEEAAQLSV